MKKRGLIGKKYSEFNGSPFLVDRLKVLQLVFEYQTGEL